MSKSRFNKELATVEALKNQLAAMRPLTATELNRLREEFMVENTYNSNAIEGNKLTLRETALILQEGMTIAGKPLKDHLEAVGHRDAFEYMVSISDASEALTERRIKEIHTLVLMNDATHKGIYRNVPVTILGATCTPPQPFLVAPQMEVLMEDYGEMKHNRHIIEAISEFHLRFEGIAPGEITDDTEMTLAVAEGIAEQPRDPIPAIGRRFVKWYDSNPKDIGNCCRTAIAYAKEAGAKDLQGWHEAAQRVHADTNGQTAGNGALMRTIYAPLWYGLQQGHTTASAIGCMTHAHDDSTLAVIAYTNAVADIIDSDEGKRHDHETAVVWRKERIEYRMERVREVMRGKTLRPDGYALNGLMLAINAIRDTGTFEDALVQVVNLGGDADTIGAITGGLAGALYGANVILQRWKVALDPRIYKQIQCLANNAAVS